MEKQVTNPLYTYNVLKKSERFLKWEASMGPRYGAYREAWNNRPVHQEVGEFPLCLSIENTTKCNLRCRFCYHKELQPREVMDMPFDLYRKIIDESSNYSMPSVNLNALGEPLIHKDLPEMIYYAKRMGIMDTMFHTNGTLLNKSLSLSLIDAGLDQIIIGVDAAEKETYEYIRVGAKYEQVVQNINRFIELRDKSGKLTPIVRITMVVTELTQRQVPVFLKLWGPIADLVTLQDMLFGKRTDEASKPGSSWRSQLRAQFNLDPEEIRERARENQQYFVCPYLYQRLVVHVDGNITVCAQRKAKEHLVLGNAKTDSLYDCYHSSLENEMRKIHSSGLWWSHPVCRDCDIALIEIYKKQMRES